MHFSGSGLHILCAYACRHGACSVTPQQENALRSIARQANSEIKKARQQFPDKNVDDICRSVLKKHRETVTLMGFTPTHLSLAIGMLSATHCCECGDPIDERRRLAVQGCRTCASCQEDLELISKQRGSK